MLPGDLSGFIEYPQFAQSIEGDLNKFPFVILSLDNSNDFPIDCGPAQNLGIVHYPVPGVSNFHAAGQSSGQGIAFVQDVLPLVRYGNFKDVVRGQPAYRNNIELPFHFSLGVDKDGALRRVA